MPTLDRRALLRASIAFAIPPGIILLFGGCHAQSQDAPPREDSIVTGKASNQPLDAKMQIQYLEIVTTDVEMICTQYSAVHGVTFTDPDPHLGGARTATLMGGGLLGVRGPLRGNETPVVRPYVLVDDVNAAVAAAAAAGADVALPPTKLQGHGICAIVIQGGIECGLWQL